MMAVGEINDDKGPLEVAGIGRPLIDAEEWQPHATIGTDQDVDWAHSRESTGKGNTRR